MSGIDFVCLIITFVTIYQLSCQFFGWFGVYIFRFTERRGFVISVIGLTSTLYARNRANNAEFNLASDAIRRSASQNFSGYNQAEVIINQQKQLAYGAMAQSAALQAKKEASEDFRLDYCA